MNIINNLNTRMKNNTFWKSVAVLVSGTTIAQLIGVFTTPIVSRLYDPRAFGEYAIIMSMAAIILNIVTLGLNSAVMVTSSDDECNDVFTVAFYTMLFLSTTIFIGMLSISPAIKLFEPGIDYMFSCFLIYIIVVLNNLSGLLNIYINRKGLNKVLLYNSLIGAFATLCITIPLGKLGFGSLGLILAGIIASLVSIVQMIHHINPFKKIPNLELFKNVYRQYKNFIFYQYPSNFILNFAVQLPTQMFSAAYGNVNLGSYFMNEKILGIPTRLIGTPINTIYFRTASEYHKEGKNLAKFTFSLIIRIMLIALLPIIVTVIWGEQIFSFVLGTSWSEAGKLSGILIVLYVFMFCSNCTTYCRVAIGKQKTNLIVSILQLVFFFISISIGMYMSRDLFGVIIAFTIGATLHSIIDMTINFCCMGKYWVRYIVFALSYFSIIMLLWSLTSKMR